MESRSSGGEGDRAVLLLDEVLDNVDGHGLSLAGGDAALAPRTGEVAVGATYDEGQRFLAGLTDPATLLDDRPGSTYDPQPAGANTPLVDPWSGPGRGVVGPRSAAEAEVESAADLLDWAAGDG